MKIKRITESKFGPIEIRFETHEEWDNFIWVLYHAWEHGGRASGWAGKLHDKICEGTQWTEIEI